MNNEHLRMLKAARVQADVSVDQIASALGVDKATVYRKFSGKSEFVLSEVIILRNLLHLSDEDFNTIFFSRKLTETQARSSEGGKSS